MRAFRTRNLLAGLLLTAACPAWAWDSKSLIVDPGLDVAGHSQRYWAQQWWKWAFSIPNTAQAANPLLDPTGASAAIGNSGPVFFLAGNLGGVSARAFYIPFGEPIIFPVVNAFFSAFDANGNFDPAPCPKPLTFSCALSQVTGVVNSATNMSVKIDGEKLDNGAVKKFRQTSKHLFTVTIPPANVFGLPTLPPGMYFPNNPVWVQDGYWVTLNLPVGLHHLHFHGEFPGSPNFVVDVNDTLTVVAAP